MNHAQYAADLIAAAMRRDARPVIVFRIPDYTAEDLDAALERHDLVAVNHQTDAAAIIVGPDHCTIEDAYREVRTVGRAGGRDEQVIDWELDAPIVALEYTGDAR